MEWTAQWHGVDLYDGDGETDQEPFEAATDNDRDGHVRLGRVLEPLLSKDFTGKLSRYEMGLQKQLTMTLKELREVAAARQDDDGFSSQPKREPAPLPAGQAIKKGHER